MALENGRFFGEARGTRSSAVATLAETSYRRGDDVPVHSHDHAFFCLVVEGGLRERFEGRKETIPEGGVLFHPAGAPHAEDFPWAPSRAFNIQPEGDWLARLEALDLALPTEQRVAAPTSRLMWLARQVRNEWRSGDVVSPLAVEGLLLGMLTEVLRATPRKPETGCPGWLLRVRDVLHASFRDSPTIAEIAAEVGVDPAHVSRSFRERFGSPPGEYLRRLKVERARKALEESDRSIAAVALDAGFYDQSHLTRTFRRYLGTTPGAYRRALRSG